MKLTLAQDCHWEKITHPINTGSGAVAGLADDSKNIGRVNLADDSELLSQIKEKLAAKGAVIERQPGVPPVGA
jgi:hypothetical protein